MRWNAKYTGLLTTIVLAGGLVAGCGSGSGSGTTATGTKPTGSAPSNSPDPGNDITVAVAAPFSGNEAFIGPRFLNGVKVAVQEINDNGGILGKKVRIVTADTAGDPVDAVPAITQIISTQHPVAMIGPSSLTIMAVVNQLNQDHLVDITLGGTTQLDNMTFPYIFRTSPSDSQMGVGMAYYGLQKGYKKSALVFSSDSSAQTLDGPVANTLKKHGAQVVTDVKVVPDQSSYRSEIETILRAQPDSIYMQVDPQTASTFFSELEQLGGANIPVIGSDVTAAADFIKAVGPKVASKQLTSMQGSTSGGQAADEYNTFYGQVFPGQQPVTLSNSAYDGMNVIALAMLEAKSTDPAKYQSYMTKVSNGPGDAVIDFKSGAAAIQAGKAINYAGASGPIDFDQYHNVTGAFQAVSVDSSGQLKTKMDISAQDLIGY